MTPESTAEARRSLRLGDILVEQGVVTEQQLKESLQYQRSPISATSLTTNLPTPSLGRGTTDCPCWPNCFPTRMSTVF